MSAHSGGVSPAATALSVAARASSGVPARGVVHSAASPGNHLVISRRANGQAVLRHTTAANETRRFGRAGAHGGQLTVARRRIDIPEFSSDSNSVPGLGFDYSHVAATHPNGVKGRHHRNDGAVLFPFFDGGYFVPTGPGLVEDAQGEGPQTENAEEEENSGPVERPARTRSADRLPALGPPAPQRDVPEYIFVRRDGTVFFAVAYSWDKGALRYVSSEGLRRSVARDTLDLDATQQFNEQRGMTFRAPA
jgi:hypothetical protein